jgi:alkylation response protein AidB-like acyl-CoA dehydrogenase
MVRDFTEREIEPIAAQIDAEGRLPDDLIGKLAGLGLLAMTVSRDDGGGGADRLSYVLAMEQLAYSGTGATFLPRMNNSVGDLISRYGSGVSKREYLPPLADGSAYASVQFTEEETGSDPAALTTRAVPDGDCYVVNGMKRFSTFGARDGYAVLYTRDETGGCTAFVIKKNVEGYVVGKTWVVMGGAGMEAADVYFENMRVPAENMIGGKGKGFNLLLSWAASAKLDQCACNVGIAQAALDEAVKYASARMSRGRPISTMQGIRWMLAEMKCRLEAARWLNYRTAFLMDQDGTDRVAEAATVKLFVVPATIGVTEMARQVHGAYGYTKDFKIERLFRAAVGATAIETSLEVNRSIAGASVAM